VTSYPLTGRLKAYYVNNVRPLSPPLSPLCLSFLSLCLSLSLSFSLSHTHTHTLLSLGLQFTKYMAIRQLKNFERTVERMNLLDEFVTLVLLHSPHPLPSRHSTLSPFLLTHQVVGKPYGFTASQIFPSKNVSPHPLPCLRLSHSSLPPPQTSSHQTHSCRSSFQNFFNSLRGGGGGRGGGESKEEIPDHPNGGGGGDREEIHETYFCSELVAAALKHMGLLPRSLSHHPSLSFSDGNLSDLNPSYFWPGCFAKGDELDNMITTTLGAYGLNPPDTFFHLFPSPTLRR
jgi:hypothetical protein